MAASWIDLTDCDHRQPTLEEEGDKQHLTTALETVQGKRLSLMLEPPDVTSHIKFLYAEFAKTGSFCEQFFFGINYIN
jgi:hypothetical protein